MMNNQQNQTKRKESNTITDLIEKSQEISNSWLEKGLPQKPQKNEPIKPITGNDDDKKCQNVFYS